ncbi:MAG: DUF1638 domain-containing protein [Rhizobiaceae bacterium]|nr:DUF1638 domain-containing protein [Rhizobiaceae bacterium]
MITGSKKLVRVIACGAIAREILAICEAGGLEHIDLSCLPAILHNSPNEIPARVEQEIIAAKESGIENIFIAYADCGTGGLLDNICEKYGVERIAGPHCYSFFSGDEAFAAQGDDAMRSFYLTDFLARQFTSFVVKPLGLDRYPQLRDMYFGHYEKLVYLVQDEDPELDKKAQEAAEFLGLKFERRYTGYGDLTANLTQL